jgi:NAD(P)-dependent dehydrogenase (short-subunit alcohol dehydrogenase family)
MRDLAGKVAVVTGAASGIGRALAEAFGAAGMKVALADVEAAALAHVARALETRGVAVAAVPTDVTSAGSVRALADTALDAFGAVHVVCNNAGVFAGGAAWTTPLEDYEWVLGVNLWGVIHGVRTFLPILLAQEAETHVVNTASMAAVTGGPFGAAYYLSKHAVLALSESLYHDLRMRQAKVGVSVLCPEVVATALGTSERNRPGRLARPGPPTEEAALVEQTLRDFTPRGTPPATIAARVLDAVRENRFYVLSDDAWRRACETRLEDIRLGRNPTYAVPTDPGGSVP